MNFLHYGNRRHHHCFLTRAPLGSGESHILMGAGAYRPPVISQTAGPISKIQTPFDSTWTFQPWCEIWPRGHRSGQLTQQVTGQVKVRMFDFSGLVTSASTISILKGRVPPFWHKTVFTRATPSQCGPVVRFPIFVSDNAQSLPKVELRCHQLRCE